jgi:hypothetical protein
MNERISALIDQIRELEDEMEAEFAKQRAELKYGIDRGRIIFEKEILQRHRELRVNLMRYVLSARFLVIVTAPVIYAVVIPLVLLDIFVTVYQAVCFPVYGISRVRRSDHIVFDRHHLAYLNLLQKLNCAYCSYANGLISYAREIAGRTEQYWCPIKHARRVIGAHANYPAFIDYGDADGFADNLEKLRSELGK